MATAEISSDGVYRYSLTRQWGDGETACFVMLNPSTADAVHDDPTIRKCVGFAKRWGFGSLEVVNLFAFRATNPAVLRSAPHPIGPLNDDRIELAASRAGRIIAAWGGGGRYLNRGQKVRERLRWLGYEVWAIRKTNGEPWHPLYLPYEEQPIVIEKPREPVSLTGGPHGK